MEPRLTAKLESHCHTEYVGRPPSAAPAVGSPLVHALQQKNLVAAALGIEIKPE